MIPISSFVFGGGGGSSVSLPIAWNDVSKEGSSLADLATRSASDLNEGTLSENRLPTISWSKISKEGSSLADLATRSASDLNSGTLSEARLPTISWSKISKEGSSLADLATRSASALNSGNIPIARMPTGGTWSLSSNLIITHDDAYYTMFKTTGNATTGIQGYYFNYKTVDSIADGFGVALGFKIEDDSDIYNLAKVQAEREGANNSGCWKLYTYNAGSPYLRLYCSHDGKLATGGKTSPDVDPGGLCLYHGTNDGYVLTCKSSDVDHGITGKAETDTYFTIKKLLATTGGVQLTGLSEATRAFYIMGIGTGSGDTNHNTSGQGRITCYGYKASGGNVTDADPDENIFVVRTYRGGDKTLFIVDEDGDYFYDGSGSAYDEYDDAIACYDASQVLARNWENILQYGKDKLHQMGVIEVTPKEKTAHKQHDDIFVSGKKMNMLLLGAVGELYKVCSTLCNKLGISYNEAKRLEG